MGSANKFIWYVFLPIIFIFYISFLFWTEVIGNQNERKIYSTIHQANIKDLNIDGLILGGSNASALSAKLIGNELEENWYSMFLKGEGGKDKIYWDFIQSSMSLEDRKKVRTIFYSSSSPLSTNLIRTRNSNVYKLISNPKFFMIPQKSIASYIKFYFSGPKKPLLEMNIEELNQMVSWPVNQFGDRSYTPTSCNNELIEIENNDKETNEKQLINWTMIQLGTINGLFPNAEIIFVIPSEYYLNEDPIRSKKNSDAVQSGISEFVSQNNVKVKLIEQPSYPSKGYLCSDGLHANPKGREWRTYNLLNSI